MAGKDLQTVKRFFLGKHVFYYKLLNPFPQVGFLSGIDSGFFALNIAMTYRHNKFREPAPTLASLNNNIPGVNSPVQRQMAQKGGLILGAGTTDDFWTANQLLKAAKGNNYKRSVIIEDLTFEKIKDFTKQDHVLLVAFDVDAQGNPGSYGGANVHWAVIVGHGVYNDGTNYVIATHSWGGFYIWSMDELTQSNCQLLNLPQSSQAQMVGNGVPTAPLNNPPMLTLNEVRNKFIVIAA